MLEREPVPGGRAGLLELDGYRFDTGPAVLTMPGLIADAFDAVGREPRGLARPATGSSRRTGRGSPTASRLDVIADVDAMAAEVGRVCGAREADGYRRFVGFARRLYDLEMRHFIDRNLDSPARPGRAPSWPGSSRSAASGGWRPWSRRTSRIERLQRVFTFQAMYAGLSPYDALAIYAVIAYMDCVAGVWFPVGGMHAVPRAMAGAAEKHGVEIRYGFDVDARRAERRHEPSRCTPPTASAIAADVVVLNPDLPVAWRDLLPESQPRAGCPGCATRRPACCCWPARRCRSRPTQAHHTIHFGQAWRSRRSAS